MLIFTATFTYNGSTSTCTNSSVNAITYTKEWKVISKNVTKKKNTATGSAIMKCYSGNDLIATKNPTVIIVCDKNGNVS